MKIQKIRMVVHIFSEFAYFTELMWVSVSRSRIPLQVVDLEQGAFWFTNKGLQVEILSMLKLDSFIESLAGNLLSERGTQAEPQCERNLNRQL